MVNEAPLLQYDTEYAEQRMAANEGDSSLLAEMRARLGKLEDDSKLLKFYTRTLKYDSKRLKYDTQDLKSPSRNSNLFTWIAPKEAEEMSSTFLCEDESYLDEE
jgi:hypothetical protein